MINDTVDNIRKRLLEGIPDNISDNVEKCLRNLENRINIDNEIKYNKENISPKVLELLKIPQYEQRSQEWFEQRKNKLTSSDVDAVLGTSKYSSYKDVLFKKFGIFPPFVSNEATKHGQLYEDEAIDIYCKRYGKKTFSFGLLPHPSIDFLA